MYICGNRHASTTMLIGPAASRGISATSRVSARCVVEYDKPQGVAGRCGRRVQHALAFLGNIEPGFETLVEFKLFKQAAANGWLTCAEIVVADLCKVHGSGWLKYG